MSRLLMVMALASTAVGLAAQPPQATQDAEKPPSFEVASVRVNTSGQLDSGLRPHPGGRFEATNVTLRRLIQWAYQIRGFQLEGGPDWADEVGFDIVE